MERLKKGRRNDERHACGVGVNCVMKNTEKCRKQWQTGQNTDRVFRHDMVNHRLPKRSENGLFSRRIVFYNSLRIYGRFPTWSPIPNAQKNIFFTRGPVPKVLTMRRKRSLNNETPCMFQNIELRCVLMRHELGLGPNKTAEVVLSVIVQHS